VHIPNLLRWLWQRLLLITRILHMLQWLEWFHVRRCRLLIWLRQRSVRQPQQLLVLSWLDWLYLQLSLLWPWVWR